MDAFIALACFAVFFGFIIFMAKVVYKNIDEEERDIAKSQEEQRFAEREFPY